MTHEENIQLREALKIGYPLLGQQVDSLTVVEQISLAAAILDQAGLSLPNLCQIVTLLMKMDEAFALEVGWRVKGAAQDA